MKCRAIPYEGEEPFLFLSYCHKDSEAVYPIFEQLVLDGYRIWYDDGIHPGDDWPENIARHLEKSSMMLAFVTDNASNSHNCKSEITFAIQLGKKLIPVLLGPVQMPLGMRMQLSQLQYIALEQPEDATRMLPGLYGCPEIRQCYTRDSLAYWKDEAAEVTPEEPEIPEVIPEEPVVEPEVPEAIPEEPVVEPEVPEVIPEQPVVEPEVPEIIPEEPVVEPEVPEAIPEVPVVEPEVPEVIPEEPVVEPEVPEIIPEQPVVEPEVPEIIPEQPVVEPEVPEVIPEEPVVEPEEPVVEPEVPEIIPEEPVVEPEVPEAIPEEPVVEPEVPEAIPEEPVVEPEVPEVIPEEPVVEPEVPEVIPEEPVVKSEVPEAIPEEPVVEPEVPEAIPEEPEVPEIIPEEPVVEPEVPEVIPEEPVVEPEMPELIFEEPVSPPDTVLHEDIPSAILIQPFAKQAFVLKGSTITLGRSEDNASLIIGGDEGISKIHATVTVEKNYITLQDEGSANGTWVEKKRLIPGIPVPLTNPAVFRLHKEYLILYAGPALKKLIQDGYVDLLLNEACTGAAILETDVLALDRSHIWADGTMSDTKIHRAAHAALKRRKYGDYLCNVGPADGNGIYLNNRRLKACESLPINSGDWIRIGKTKLEFLSIKIKEF